MFSKTTYIYIEHYIMPLYMYVFVYIHKYIHICIHKYIHICIHKYIHTYTTYHFDSLHSSIEGVTAVFVYVHIICIFTWGGYT